MSYDIIVLKAAPDAGSEQRLQRAMARASDPATPRRSLVAGQLAEVPADRVGTMLDPGRSDVDTSSYADSQIEWEGMMAAAGLDPDPGVGPSDLGLSDRLVVYDALPEAQRARWDEQFREAADEWVEVVRSWGRPRALGRRWGRHVEEFETPDGGLLLVCASAEGDYLGVPSWFEGVRFLLAEVAAAAGYHEPTIFDVT